MIAQFFAYDSTFFGGVNVAAGKLQLGNTRKASIITGPGPGNAGSCPGHLDQANPVEVWQVNNSLDGSAHQYDTTFNAGRFPGGGVAEDGAGNPISLNCFSAYGSFAGGVRLAAGKFHAGPDDFEDIVTGAGPGGGPHVQVFRGDISHTILRSFYAYDSTFGGGVFVAAGNYLGHADHNADIMTGPGYGGGPNVRIFDGATGVLIRNFMAFDPRGNSSGVGGVAFNSSSATNSASGHLNLVVTSGRGQRAQMVVIDGSVPAPGPTTIVPNVRRFFKWSRPPFFESNPVDASVAVVDQAGAGDKAITA